MQKSVRKTKKIKEFSSHRFRYEKKIFGKEIIDSTSDGLDGEIKRFYYHLHQSSFVLFLKFKIS